MGEIQTQAAPTYELMKFIPSEVLKFRTSEVPDFVPYELHIHVLGNLLRAPQGCVQLV